MARAKEVAWGWHAWLGHLDFQSLKKMAAEKWVRGLPKIEQVDQLCDGCLADKHHHAPFRSGRSTNQGKASSLFMGIFAAPSP
jgi:hypothetical protein